MLSVVCWRWRPRPGYRSTYPPSTVNTLAAMVRRHYPHQHRFICVTDDPDGIDRSRVEVLPDFGDFTGLPSPHGQRNPSCYRRLRMFHPEAARWFGERFVAIDLDVVLTGDLSPLWNRNEDIVLWGDTNPTTFYNGSMLLLTAGARAEVWNDFDPIASPAKAKASGQFGSDQGWISYRLGPNEAKWSRADGVYSYRVHLNQGRSPLPENAKVVVFHGQIDPWSSRAQSHHWVREHYRADVEVSA